MIKRQKYHLEPDRGLLNDPNGLVFYKDMYHVFFQWNRFEKNHSYKEWGHFTSKDLLHWNWEGSALLPDQFYEQNGVYSGSALIKDGQLRLFYTGNNKSGGVRKSSQCLAVTEDGKTFQKKGIVVSTPTEFTEHFRDPKVWQDGDDYYMVIGAQMKNGRGSVALCSSKDAENWKFELVLAKSKEYEMVECPDYFQVDGQGILLYCPQHRDNESDSSLCSFSAYKEFDFNDIVSGKIEDSNVQNLDEGRKKMDQGFDFYAPQTFLTEDGRRILIGWAGVPDAGYDSNPMEEGWQHCLTVPRELTWHNGKIYQYPVRELTKLREGEWMPDNTGRVTIPGKCGEIIAEDIRTELGAVYMDSGCVIKWDKGHVTLSFKDETGAGRSVRNARVSKVESIRILVDVSVLEVYINRGEVVMTSRFFMKQPDMDVCFEGRAERLKFYQIGGRGCETFSSDWGGVD